MLARCAQAEHSEVPGLQGEAEVVEEAFRQGAEDLVGDLDDLGARLADEMLVEVVGEVVHGAAVTEVHVVDDAEILEVAE